MIMITNSANITIELKSDFSAFTLNSFNDLRTFTNARTKTKASLTTC